MKKFDASPLSLLDVLLVRVRSFDDERGSFMETFSRREFQELGIGCEFVQDNQSASARAGTIRGLHFQRPPNAQAKLVRVLVGSVFDVAVDLRAGSASYGQWCGATLTAAGREQIFIPRGFAHGFCTLEPNTIVAYKVDDYYAPSADAGIAWNDPDIRITWPIAPEEVVLSKKDAALPRLGAIAPPFSDEARQ